MISYPNFLRLPVAPKASSCSRQISRMNAMNSGVCSSPVKVYCQVAYMQHQLSWTRSQTKDVPITTLLLHQSGRHFSGLLFVCIIQQRVRGRALKTYFRGQFSSGWSMVSSSHSESRLDLLEIADVPALMTLQGLPSCRCTTLVPSRNYPTFDTTSCVPNQ